MIWPTPKMIQALRDVVYHNNNKSHSHCTQAQHALILLPQYTIRACRC